MKRAFFSGLLLFILGTATSCIFDGPNDRFYRTLWKSDEVPLGPFSANELILEFLCGQNISIKTDTDALTGYGTYESDGQTAVFHNLTLTLADQTITFIDGYKSDETLFLRWRTEDSEYPFTTSMHRLSAYE